MFVCVYFIPGLYIDHRDVCLHVMDIPSSDDIVGAFDGGLVG